MEAEAAVVVASEGASVVAPMRTGRAAARVRAGL